MGVSDLVSERASSKRASYATLTQGLQAFGIACLVLGCRGADADLGGIWECGNGCFMDRSLPSDVGPAFNNAVDSDPSAKPVIVYPLAESMHPRNLASMTVQWRRGRPEHVLFRLRLASPLLPSGRAEFYVPCLAVQGGCRYSLPEEAWRSLTMELSGSQAELTVSASDGYSGPVAHSDPVTLRFTPQDAPGGLYYWSSRAPPPLSDLSGASYRLAFGARRAAPFIVPRTDTNHELCGGCHVVSRNGSTIAFTATDILDDEAQAGNLVVATTRNPTTQLVTSSSNIDSAMLALTNDGKRALVAVNNELVLYETSAGTLLGKIAPELLGSERQAYFPEFAPDDSELVVTLSDAPDTAWAVTTGSIAVLSHSNGTFGEARVIVPMTDTEYHYYPSWSPDGKWIAFVSAPRMANGTRAEKRSYNQPASRLRLVSREGGSVYELARATQGVGHTSTWPKFAPFLDKPTDPMLIVFNSKIDYGLMLPNSTFTGDKIPQLWLSAIDVSRLPEDPSSAPVWLPFQDFGQKNHLAYWTTKVSCREDAGAGSCGPSEYCDVDECRPIVR